MITAKKSGKNPMKCHAIIKKTKAWLNAYPKATEEQVRAYARRNMGSLRYLAPSGSNPAHHAMIERLNTLSHEPSSN